MGTRGFNGVPWYQSKNMRCAFGKSAKAERCVPHLALLRAGIVELQRRQLKILFTINVFELLSHCVITQGPFASSFDARRLKVRINLNHIQNTSLHILLLQDVFS